MEQNFKFFDDSMEYKNRMLASNTLREEFPNTEFFLVRIFPYLDRIPRFTWTLFT